MFMQREYKQLGAIGTPMQKSTPLKMLTRPFEVISNWFKRFDIDILSQINPQAVVLDACCGYGVGTATLARSRPDISVIGADIYTDTDIVENTLNYYLPENAKLISCDVCELPMRSNTIDLSYCMSGIGYIKDALKYIQELHRVLKPQAISHMYLMQGEVDICVNIRLESLLSRIKGIDYKINTMRQPSNALNGNIPYYEDGLILSITKNSDDFYNPYKTITYVDAVRDIKRPMEKYYVSAVYE